MQQQLHPFKVFRLRLDMCADCGKPRGDHWDQPAPTVAIDCRCTPPLLYWGDCAKHGAPWNLVETLKGSS